MYRTGVSEADSNSREYINQKCFNQNQVRTRDPINQVKVLNNKNKLRDQRTKSGSYATKLIRIDNAGMQTRN